MDRHAPDGLRDDVAQRRARLRRADRALARPRPAGLRGDGALRADQHATRSWRWPAACCARHPGLYMQTHVAENRDEVRWVRELFPEARSYLDVYARAGLLHARSVLAHGIWLDDADRALLRDARRADRALPERRTCSSAAACSAGARPRTPAWPSAWPATSAAAPACRCCARWPTPTRCRRWPAPSSPPGRCCTRRRAARRMALGLGDEIGSLEAGALRRRVRLGLGRRPGGAAPPAGGARLA